MLFTTRDKKTAVKLASPNIVDVPEMDEDGAMQLLQKSLAEPVALAQQRDAKSLLRELTYLPLAIVQAVAYMNKNGIAPADYLSLFDEQEEDIVKLLSKEFEDDWRYSSVKKPVATTWLISFEQIRTRDPLAAEYLSFMACIDRKGVPQSLLPVDSSHMKDVEAIGTLRAYSFIVKRGEAMVFDLHRLVHLVTRSWLQKEGVLSQWGRAAIERPDDLFPDNEHQNRTEWRLLLPHAAFALRLDIVTQDDSRRRDLAWKYAMSLHSDGRYREAEVPLEEVFRARQKMLGEKGQSRDEEAVRLMTECIRLLTRKLGADHPNTLSSIRTLNSWKTENLDIA
ncbi:hypothetical protein LTS18_007282 [Coniosporium uncinatum]|uniref:Uncharacterized protein n=1 Tax=Coniosporium uncinatum TaxID=93489 RepID=A0ACC3DXB5_9PEZI|nr:hypothetical protein LTS18_007282 [Coniosporium uncinatum]